MGKLTVLVSPGIKSTVSRKNRVGSSGLPYLMFKHMSHFSSLPSITGLTLVLPYVLIL